MILRTTTTTTSSTNTPTTGSTHHPNNTKPVRNSNSSSMSPYNNNNIYSSSSILRHLRYYYHRMIPSNDTSSSTSSSNSSNVPFILATASVFVFFGIHNYLQELIQHEFQLYHLPLNVMLGYYEVLGVCVFTYLERYIMIVFVSSSTSVVPPQRPSPTTTSTTTTSLPSHIGNMEEGGNSHTTHTMNTTTDHENHSKESHHHQTTIATRRAPLSVYPFLTLCLLSSSALSNLSLNYINFPTKVVFRSCKLLPTMVIATLLHPHKKKFSMIEYICATIVCLGLICFGMAEFQTQPTFHPIGILFVSLSVFADALLPNAQEKVFVQYHAPRSEVTFYTNLFTLMIMTISTYASGDLFRCFRFMSEHSTITIYIFIYTIISYIAISCHMNVVQMYGGVAAVLVATGRKAMTLIVSFLLFPKVYTIYYPIGTILVLSGLTWASLSKVYSKGGNNNSHGNNNNNNNSNSKKSETMTMNTDAGVVPLLLAMKSRRSDIMNEDDDDDDNHDESHIRHTATATLMGHDNHR